MAVIAQEITDRYAVYNGDSCEIWQSLPAESMHLTIHSPPFPELYNYSSSPRDLSNCQRYELFFPHYEYIVREIARTTKPGRMACVHAMDLKGLGVSQRDFPGDIIRLYEKHGMEYQGRHTIWKDPLKVAIRTRALHLAHRQLVKDSTFCHVAGADYLLIFRRVGTNKEPVKHPTGLSRYSGEEPVPQDLQEKYHNWKDPKTNKLAHWIWRRYASSVWMDIRAGRVLPFRAARESEEEKHVCPLQMDVIERCLVLYSNPGDTVGTPFLGVGSEVYCSLKEGRRAIGSELKESYYRQALRNVQAAILGTDEDDQKSLNFVTPEADDEGEFEKEMA